MKTYRTAKVAIFDKGGNVLLLRRSKTHPTQALIMDLPGGIIEPGEQPLATLIREIKEETGLVISEQELALIYAATEEANGENAVRLVYATKLGATKPKVQLSWEHDQYHWLPMEEAIAQQLDWRYTRHGLEHIRDKNLLKDLDA